MDGVLFCAGYDFVVNGYKIVIEAICMAATINSTHVFSIRSASLPTNRHLFVCAVLMIDVMMMMSCKVCTSSVAEETCCSVFALLR